MSENPTRSNLIIAAAIVIAGVLIAASLLFAVGSMTRTTTVTYTSATTFTTTVFVPSSNSSLLSDCSRAQAPPSSGEMFGEVTVAKTSPALICVQFYYFDTMAAMTLNLASAFVISAQSPGRSFDGSGNFSVVPSQMQLVVGGPNGENEGAVVAYAVTARAGASGTYELFGFSSDGYYLGNEPLECGFYGELVAGNGQPEYTNPGGFNGCLTYSMSNTSGSPTIQGVQYPLMTGSLYFRVVGVINSTQ